VPVVLRLKRVGAKGKPQYRIVAADKRRSRDGKNLETLGTYNPHTVAASQVKLDRERIGHWLGVGAQVSDTVKILLKKQGVALR